MKILIVVLSHLDGGIYTKFFDTQNESWNSVDVEGVDTFFLVGNSDKDKVEGNLIKTNVRESLYNCGHKTIKAFELLKDYLQDKPRTNFYSGVIGNHYGIKFASGSGFIVSKNVVDLVLLKKEYWEHRFIDDVALGLLLRNLRINPTLAPRYDVETVNEKTPMNYYHYRIKTFNRDNDCQFMKSIFELKKLSYK